MKNSFTKADIGAGYSSHKEDIFKRIFSLKETEMYRNVLCRFTLSHIFLYKSILLDYNVNGPQCWQRIKYYQLAGFVEFRKLYFAEVKPLGNFLWTRVIFIGKSLSYIQSTSREDILTSNIYSWSTACIIMAIKK